MTSNKYLQIKQCLQVVDNKNHVEDSKVAKIKLLYDASKMTLKQFGLFYDKLWIDKAMVTHKGLYLIHQYIKSKPIAWIEDIESMR